MLLTLTKRITASDKFNRLFFYTIAQIVQFLSLFIVTKASSGFSFGTYSGLLAAVNLLSTFVSFRLETSIDVVDSTSSALYTARIIYISALVALFCLLLGYILLHFFPLLSGLYPSVSYAHFLLIVFSVSSTNIFVSYLVLNSNNIFPYLARASIGLFTSVYQVIFLSTNLEQPLVKGFSAGSLSALFFTVTLYCLSLASTGADSRTIFFNQLLSTRLHHLFEILIFQKKTITVTLSADSISAIIQYLPVLLITKLYGLEFLGIFSFFSKYLGAFQTVLSVPLLDSYRVSIRSCRKLGLSLIPVFNKYLKQLSLVSILVLTPINLLFLVLVNLGIFGEQWMHLLKLGFLLSVLSSVRYVATTLSYSAYLTSSRTFDLVWQIILLSSVLSLATLKLSFEMFSSIYVTIYCLLYVALVLFYSIKFNYFIPSAARSPF